MNFATADFGSVLSGEQWRLRRWHLDDAPRLLDAWCDAEIARWNAVPAAPTIELALRWISNEQRRLDQRQSVDLVIDLDDAAVVGEVGLSGFSNRHQGALIGYWLLPQGRGHGIAAQAVDAVAEWAFRELDLAVLVAQCSPENEASHAVLRRADFAHERTDEAGSQLWRRRRVDVASG